MGWTKRQRRIAIGSCVWLFGALFVLGGGVALADVVPDVPQAVGDTAGGVTDAVVDPVDEVTDAVDDTVDGVTQAVDDTVDAVTEATSNAANGAASAAGAAASSATASGGEGQAGSSESETGRPGDRRASPPSGGQPEPVASARVPYGLREPMPAVVAWSGPFAEPEQGGAQTDPCEQDESLVCLGVLYGLGEFADAGTEVLGVLVTTGVAVIGLMMLAAGLAVAGAWALVAARTTPAGAAERAV